MTQQPNSGGKEMLTRFAAATALGLIMSLAPAAAQQSNQPSGNTGAKVDVVPAQEENEMLAQNMVGSNVYNHNNEKIGDINDLVIERDGKVKAIVVGVGGFLGIGERNVAIPYHDAKIMHRAEYDQMYGNRGGAGGAGTGAARTGTGAGGAGTTAGGTGAGGAGGAGGTGAGGAGTTAGGTGAAGGTGTTAGTGAGTTAAANQPTDRDLRFVVDASKDQLKNMPVFTRLSDRNRNTANRGAGGAGGGPTTTGATGGTGAGGTGMGAGGTGAGGTGAGGTGAGGTSGTGTR
jgi:sporulation protein YlmC with PRC-barrel domain